MCGLFIDCIGTHAHGRHVTSLLCQGDVIITCVIITCSILAYSGPFGGLV